MTVQVPANVQKSITALKDNLREKFMSPARINYDDQRQTVSVIFSGSNDPNRPQSIASLDIYEEKVGKFEKLLGRKKVEAQKTASAQIPVEYEGHSFTANSTSFTFPAAELGKLLPKRQQQV